jgi:hypothetical protein
LVREYGYAPKGKRIEDTRRGRKFHRVNVVGGLIGGVVVGALCYEHSTCGVFFEWWFETQFLPRVVCGVVVFLDNAWFHRRRQLCALAAVAGVFLPAYSPDFNRIEHKWSSMKRALPDLMPKCENLQDAVYTHFAVSNC